MIKTAKDLRHATYNPRSITDKRLSQLANSIESFGDLSGIVFNARTKTMVAGHQRTTSLNKWKSKAVLKAHKDEYGTIQMGHMEWATDRGVIRIPMRVVDWDRKKEMSANIAANAHGGDFDRKKLAPLVAQLERGKKFDIELLGFDHHDLVLLQRLDKNEKAASADSDDEGEEEFGSVVGDLNEARKEMVCCPKCKFEFAPKKRK